MGFLNIAHKLKTLTEIKSSNKPYAFETLNHHQIFVFFTTYSKKLQILTELKIYVNKVIYYFY